MDQIVQTIEPVKQFAKDSIRLVKRCTKPDKKGKNRRFFHDRQIANNFNFDFRIPKDCYCYRYWIRHYGLHRLLCQIDPHSHQQHHRRLVEWLLQAAPLLNMRL